MAEKTKIVEIGETRYQIRRLSAEDGTFVLMQLMAASVKGIDFSKEVAEVPADKIEEAEKAIEKNTPEDRVRSLIMGVQLRGTLDYDMHRKIQRMCLAACSRVESQSGSDLVLPISTANGTLLPDIADDLPLVMRLEMEALVFNLSSFFAGGGWSAVAGNPASKV
jgi:hypothetical protein